MKEIGEYYNTAHFLRPVNPKVVENYAALMKDGVKTFPNIVLGKYKGEGGKEEKLIVDGVHIYRACQLAKITSHTGEVVVYESLAEALADQLKRNLHHGLQISTAQRDARIRQLIEVYNWTTRQVATVVGMDHSSVSRINRKKQNVSETGKPGASTDAKKAGGANNKPGPYSPRQFIRAVESMALTLKQPDTRAQALAEIYNPKRDPKEIQHTIALLQGLLSDLAELVRQPTVRPARLSAVQRAAEIAA
jgi:ParB-like chromosome segregation protein Spo0J